MVPCTTSSAAVPGTHGAAWSVTTPSVYMSAVAAADIAGAPARVWLGSRQESGTSLMSSVFAGAYCAMTNCAGRTSTSFAGTAQLIARQVSVSRGLIMGSSIKRLFDDELPLETVLARHNDRALAEVAQLAPSDVLTEDEHLLRDRLMYRPVTLMRERAVVRSEAVGSALGVTLQIPFEGDPEVFWHRPMGQVPVMEARVHDGSGFYSEDPNEQCSVEFEQLFAPDAEVAELREWAQRVTDDLEQVLDYSRELVDAFNQDLAPAIANTLAGHSRALAGSASLQQSFGTGI